MGRADVAVVGSGLAALALAHRLSDGGVDVILLGAGDADAVEEAGIGLVETTTPEPFRRTVGLLGAGAAASLHELSRRNADQMSRLPAARAAGFTRSGAFHLTTDAAELEEISDSARLMRRHRPGDAPWEILDAGAAAARTATTGFVGGVFRPDDASIDPLRFLEEVEGEARRSGARIEKHLVVTRIDMDAAEGPRLHTQGGVVRAEMAVLAAGASGVTLNGMVREKVVPVLGQGLTMEGPGAGPPPDGDRLVPISANFGHLRARRTRRAGGGMALAAWNIPWSLKGSEPDGSKHEVLEDQQNKIARYLTGHFPDASGARVGRRGAAHLAWTADTLPIAGPAPGQPRLIFCTGFCGHEWSLAWAVAQAVADGVTGQPPPGGFELLSPRRFMTG